MIASLSDSCMARKLGVLFQHSLEMLQDAFLFFASLWVREPVSGEPADEDAAGGENFPSINKGVGNASSHHVLPHKDEKTNRVDAQFSVVRVKGVNVFWGFGLFSG